MVTSTSRVFEPAGKIGALWCVFLHDSPTWPIHGHYECRVCGRQYQVPWAETLTPRFVSDGPSEEIRFHTLRKLDSLMPREVSSTIAAEGLIAADDSGNFKLTIRDHPWLTTDVTVTVESDCFVQIGLALPAEAGETITRMTLRGILLNDGRDILAIQTDPGASVSASFTARQ